MSVDKKELRRLPQHLLEIPAQAIPCHLAGIVSVEPEWCTGAIDFFKGNRKFIQSAVNFTPGIDFIVNYIMIFIFALLLQKKGLIDLLVLN